MASTLLFVHGTGVRGERYTETLKLIARGVETHALPVEVAGCYWGDAEGARLRARGRSIPGYDDTGGQDPDEAAESAALWSLLYTDPWYELRLLRHMPVAGEVAFGEEPPAEALRSAVERFTPSAALATELGAVGLAERFADSLIALRAAAEFDQAAQTAPADPLEHRRAIARALIAHAIVAADERSAPPVDGRTRDALVERLTNELHGFGMGVPDFLARPVRRLGARMIMWKPTRDRGAVTDKAAPLAGDVLRFLAAGDGARAFVRSAVADLAPGPVYVLAHSLGGIMAVDLLVRGEIAEVAGLVTVGSQSPFLYEIGALPGLSHPDPLPGHFPPWLNIWDRRDILSYIGAGVFGAHVTDVEVDNGQPFPFSHSAYWSNRDVWSAIKTMVG